MPDWEEAVRRRLEALHLEATAEAGLAEEMAQHLEDKYRELCEGGCDPDEARRRILAELEQEIERSHAMRVRESVLPGEAKRGHFAADLARDLRYTWRSMRKAPLFVFFVVCTLALGIGANTTVFTVINTLLLNPLPVHDLSSLAAVGRVETKQQAKSTKLQALSYPDLKDYRAQNSVFSSLAGYSGARPVTLQTGASSQRLFAELVTGNYFGTLGLKPALGRFFLPEEDSTPGGHAVAVLNYATWQARFAGSPKVLGQTLQLNHVVFTIVGVAPPQFLGVTAIFGPDLWAPATMAEQLLPGEMAGALGNRKKAAFQAIGRLKPGVNREQAQANLAGVAAALAREYPDSDEGYSVAARPVSEVIFGQSGFGGSQQVLGSVVLLVVVMIVLLIACSNVANLLLARSAARGGEMAVRLALGASRGRLVRQLLTESACLGLLAGAVGLALGAGGTKLLWSFMPADVAANLIAPKLDANVFFFGLILSLATGFIFGSIPAVRASRTSVVENLKEEARTTGKSRRKVTLANGLLVGQVAFSFLSLLTAALFLRSIERAYQIDPGFQVNHLAVVLTNPGQAGYNADRTKTFYKEARERVATLPGVQSASWSSSLPLWNNPISGIEVEGRQPHSKADTVTSVMTTVDLGYFETAGIALEKGRVFNSADREKSLPVAIINAKMAHTFWPQGNAIGRHIKLPAESITRQIVGVVKTANYSNLNEPPQNCVYVPLEQNFVDGMTLYVRTAGNPQTILLSVQRELRAIAPEVTTSDARTGRTIVGQSLFGAQLGVALLAVFGLLALALASVGLYGIMAYSVRQRQREIGVRMALGAAQISVVGMILKQGMTLVLSGVVLGWLAALVAGRLLTRLLYGVGAADPLSVGVTAIVLLSVAVLACYLPARWASRVDPLTALREG